MNLGPRDGPEESYSVRVQIPYRFHRRNHGLAAYLSSCLRFAASRSVKLSGLLSGSAKMRFSHSISAMVFSTSIPFQFLLYSSPRLPNP